MASWSLTFVGAGVAGEIKPPGHLRYKLPSLTPCTVHCTPNGVATMSLTATLNGAIVLGRDKDLGSLEKGKWADLQVIDGNPLKSFEVLGKPEIVMIGGKVTVL